MVSLTSGFKDSNSTSVNMYLHNANTVKRANFTQILYVRAAFPIGIKVTRLCLTKLEHALLKKSTKEYAKATLKS